MPDQQILEHIRTGHSDKALASLYKHYPMTRKMVRTYGGNAADAEDIFQEALIILVRNVRERDLHLTSKLSTYLYGICRLLWKEELRRHHRPLPPGLGQEPSDIDGPGDKTFNLDMEEHARLAEKALDELGDRCRELLVLFYHAGVTLKNIASRMGYRSENTAKNQKYKCLEAAKLRFKELTQIHQTL